MKITVIVCTYNRGDTVHEALDTIAAQELPENVEWDVLVVDNNSTDHTRAVLERYCRQHQPRFGYIFEPKQGLSNARNAGIAKAGGDILAFTDDDVFVDPGWLLNLTSALVEGREWSGCGGRIIPVWNGLLPEWLSVEDVATLGPFAGFDEGPDPKALSRPPYGGNAAFRREIFERYGGFRADLGRSNNNLQGREDIELGNRLFAGGERLRYEPGAVIRCPIDPARMTRRYLLRWYYWEGRSEIADEGRLEARWSLMGVPLYLLRRLVRWVLQSLIAASAQQRFFCQRHAWKLAGQIAGCFHIFTCPKDENRSSTQSQLSDNTVAK